jgi:hypothetical protein
MRPNPNKDFGRENKYRLNKNYIKNNLLKIKM